MEIQIPVDVGPLRAKLDRLKEALLEVDAAYADLPEEARARMPLTITIGLPEKVLLEVERREAEGS